MTSTAGETPGDDPRPPVARRVPRIDTLHGERRVDDYAWLRGKEDPAVPEYLEAENAYADAVMAATRPLQETLYREMLGRILETDMGVPYRKGDFFYYSRTEEGKQYPIYCRRRGLDGAEEMTLDLNVLAAGRAFMALGAYAVSDDGAFLAYSTDVTGFRQYTLAVRDLRTGEILPDRAERVGSVAWAADNATLLYTVESEQTKRQHRLYRHRLGARDHVLVYEEGDEAFNIGVGRTRSGSYLVLGIGSHTTSEARFLRADAPEADWRLVAPRVAEQEYEIDHHGDRFYIRVNDTGRNFRLASAPVASPGREEWVEVVPHRHDVMLEGMDFFRDHYVLWERQDGLPQIRVTSLRDGRSHRVSFPEPVYSTFPSANAVWETGVYRFSYQSLVTPASVFDYDMDSRERTLLKEQPVLGGYDRARYVSERIHATAPDGAGVPVSLVYREGLARNGRAPCLLTGYGAYGFPMPITFSSNRLSLLDRGVVFAIAHVRGGGELGKAWHDGGRMMKKRNTFTDFVAVAEHLVKEGYTGTTRLAIEGGSAGGLLMGAVANMRPELFRAVISRVPFVDVINTMLDETLPLTVSEFEEWGNPKEKEHYDYMKTYCPYTNLEARLYPTMLVKTSFHDSQVMYWEPAKYVARLRRLAPGSRLLLKTNMSAGHGGASGRYDYLREIAFDDAFLLTELEIAPSRPTA
jgi:oligopeptidase B